MKSKKRQKTYEIKAKRKSAEYLKGGGKSRYALKHAGGKVGPDSPFYPRED